MNQFDFADDLRKPTKNIKEMRKKPDQRGQLGALRLCPPTLRPPVHFFQFRRDYRPSKGRVEAKRRQRPGPPPGDHELLIGGVRWLTVGELRLG